MTFVDHFNQVTNTLTEKLRSKADGKTIINLFNELNRTTLDAIALVNNIIQKHTNKLKFIGNRFLDRVWYEYRK